MVVVCDFDFAVPLVVLPGWEGVCARYVSQMGVRRLALHDTGLTTGFGISSVHQSQIVSY
jgi:hypothetical protein